MNKIPFLILALCFILSSCRTRWKTNNQDTRFAKYISGYSPANQSANSSFRVELATRPDSNVQGKLKDSAFCLSLFDITPRVQGIAYYDGDRSLYFQPVQKLHFGSDYVVAFKLNKLLPVTKELSAFVFNMQTYQQTLNVSEMTFHPYDDFDINHYFYTVNLTFSDVIDTTYILQHLSLYWNGSKQPFSLQNEYSNHFLVEVDSLLRKNEEGVMEFRWDDEDIKLHDFMQSKLTLNSMSDYNVSHYEITDLEEQYIMVHFSDALQLNQELNGLISLDGNFQQDIAVENNMLSIHVKNRLAGNHELKLYKGIKNAAGFPLHHDTVLALSFGDIKPHLRLVQSSGSILPNSQGLFLPFDALGIHAVDVRIIKIFENNTEQFLQVNDLDGSDELRRVGKIIAEKKVTLCSDSSQAMNNWCRYILDLDKIFKADPSGIYRIQIRFTKQYTNLTKGEMDSTQPEAVAVSEERDDEDNDENGEDEIDDATYESWRGYENNLSPDDDEYYRGMGISKNMLASNIGMICKQSKTETFVWTTDLVSGKPMAHVQCYFFNFQNQEVASVQSNENGYAAVSSQQDLFLIKACYGSQRGYLKVKSKYLNDISKFDADGVNPDEHVSAFLYTERGVWRPGDSIYMHCVLRSGHPALPENYPLNFELENPSGQILVQRTLTENLHHTYPVYFSTPSQAETGIYVARIKAGNNVYEKRIPIETIKPNRLKIQYDMQDSLLSSWNHQDSIHLHSSWLTGANCSALKAEISAQYKPDYSLFKQYQDYTFGRNDEKASLEYAEVYEGSLNERGDGRIGVNLSGRSQDMLHVNLLTKVFEPGGDYSIDNTTVAYSCYEKYTGINIGGEMSSPYLFTDKNYTVKLQTIRQNGKPCGGTQVRFRIYCFTNTWWWQESEIGENDYTGRSVKIGIKDSSFLISELGTSFTFKARRSGRYLFICEDILSKQCSRCTRFFDQQYWEGNSAQLQEGAAQLLLSTNKKSYSYGEQVIVSIPNTSEGSALITLEKGNQLLKSEWVKTQEGNTYYTFRADARMCPNLYVHVTYIRPHLLTSKKMPLRMFGVLPVPVTNEHTILHPVVQCPLIVEPTKPFTIEVKERNGKGMSYSLVLVDEGLLDITHFKTPDAWHTFYAKQKLIIKTWDDYSDVIGAYAGSLKTKLNIGGDGSEEEDSYDNKTNRFKPVVQCLGLFYSSGKLNRHTVVLPHYMGKVKIMVVANDDSSFGETEQSLVVTQPLMILPTLPRVLMPGNKVVVPLTVFANDISIKQVKLNIITDSSIECIKKNMELQFTRVGEQVLEFPLLVKERIGKTKIILQAFSGNRICMDTVYLDIVAPNAIHYDHTEMSLATGRNSDLPFLAKGYSGSYKAVVSISIIPQCGFEQRLDYLLQYPHGCVEQTTSTAFPQLYLSSVMDMSDSAQKKCAANVQVALQRLASFQTSNGGFAYWPGSGYEDAYASNYVAEFLSEAEKKGFNISPYMKNRLISYLTEKSNDTGEEGDVLKAYRLFVLANWNRPNLGAMNRLKESGRISVGARVSLAKAYNQCQQISIAHQLLSGMLKKEFSTNHEYFESGFTHEVEWLDVLRLNGDHQAEAQMKFILLLNQQSAQLNTKECSAFLKSFCQYYGNVSDKIISVNYTMNGKAYSINSKKKMVMITIKGNSLHLQNNGSELYINSSEQYVPQKEMTAITRTELTMNIGYTGMDNKVLSVNHLPQGTDLRVIMEIENKSSYTMDYMSLQYTLPPGWQLVRVEDEKEDNREEHRYLGDYLYRYYFQLQPHQKRKTVFVVNATYKGSYSLPKAFTECMYNSDLRTELNGGSVVVE